MATTDETIEAFRKELFEFKKDYLWTKDEKDTLLKAALDVEKLKKEMKEQESLIRSLSNKITQKELNSINDEVKNEFNDELQTPVSLLQEGLQNELHKNLIANDDIIDCEANRSIENSANENIYESKIESPFLANTTCKEKSETYSTPLSSTGVWKQGPFWRRFLGEGKFKSGASTPSPTIHTYTIYSTINKHWSFTLFMCAISFLLISLQYLSLYFIIIESTYQLCERQSDCPQGSFCSSAENSKQPRCVHKFSFANEGYLLYNESSLQYLYFDREDNIVTDCTLVISEVQNINDLIFDYKNETETTCYENFVRNERYDLNHQSCTKHSDCVAEQACGINQLKPTPHCFDLDCFWNSAILRSYDNGSYIVEDNRFRPLYEPIDCTNELNAVEEFDSVIIDKRNNTQSTCYEAMFCNHTTEIYESVYTSTQKSKTTHEFKLTLVFLSLLALAPILCEEIHEADIDEHLLNHILEKSQNYQEKLLAYPISIIQRIRLYSMPFLSSFATSVVIASGEYLVKDILLNILSVLFLLEIDNLSMDFILSPSQLEELNRFINETNERRIGSTYSWLWPRFISLTAAILMILLVLVDGASTSTELLLIASSCFAFMHGLFVLIQSKKWGLFIIDLLKSSCALMLVSFYIDLVSGYEYIVTLIVASITLGLASFSCFSSWPLKESISFSFISLLIIVGIWIAYSML